MFEMICRVFKIAGNSRRKIVAGIVCNILKSFFNGFMMFGVFWILLHLDGLSPAIIGQAFGVILGSVLGRFFFQWMYDRTMSGSGYDIFRDYRLEIGERLKQAPMGYVSEQNLGTIQAMLTTTIADLEGYSMLAIEQMTSGVAMPMLTPHTSTKHWVMCCALPPSVPAFLFWRKHRSALRMGTVS